MRIFILITIFLLSPTLWWNTLHSEKIDLVKLQKQEKERREKTKKSVLTVTNDTLSTMKANNNHYTVTIIKPNKTNNWGNLYQNFPVQDKKETPKPPAPGEDKEKKERKDSQEITFYDEPYGGFPTSGYIITPRMRALTYQINQAKRVIGELQGDIMKNERILKGVQRQKVMYPPVQEQQEKLYENRINKLGDAIKGQQDKITALEKELREEYERINLPFPGDYPIRGGSNSGNHHIAPVDQNQSPINNGNTNGSSSRVGRNNGSVPGGSSSHLSPGGSKANFDVKRHQNNANINPPGNHLIAPANQNQTHINNGNTNNSGNINKNSSRVGRNNGSVPGGSSSHLSPGGSKSNFDVHRHQNNTNIRSPQPQFRIQRKR